MTELLVRRIDPGVPLPARAHPGDAGLDLHAADDVTLKPEERAAIRTGIEVAIPEGHAGLVLPRSGLAARHGIALANAPGLIDAGYRGEVRVLLMNHDRDEAFEVRRGDRIAQIVLVAIPEVTVLEAAELPPSARAGGGFGSTGR